MSVSTPAKPDEVLAEWRRGGDAEGMENPAGPLFDGYAESEITMTGPLDSMSTCASLHQELEPLCQTCC